MNTAEYSSLNKDSQPRQQLLQAVQELPEALIPELLQYADYLQYRKNHELEEDLRQKDRIAEASEGYRKMKASGFIGMIEAEPDLSSNYKSTLFAEAMNEDDHC